jgi:hypothetical protein
VVALAFFGVESVALSFRARLHWRLVVMAGKNDNRIGVAGTF